MANTPRKTPLNQRKKSAPSNQRRNTSSAGRRPSVSPQGSGKTTPPTAGPQPISSGGFLEDNRKLGFDEEGLHIPTGNSEVLLSRRQLLFGAAGIAALGAVGAGAKVYGDIQDEKSAIYTLTVPEDAVISLDDLNQGKEESLVGQIAELNMPYGTLIWANTDTVAACLVPTTKSKPIAKIAILSIAAGTYDTVISQAMQQDEGYEIYDVRMCENGIIWTESNILQGAWSIWAAPVVGTSVGEPVKVETGDANWELPSLAAVGAHAYWQLRPSLSGDATYEDSQVKAALFTKLSESKTVYTSTGRFATALYPTNKGIVLTPRHPNGSSYYQLVHLSETTDEVLNSITIPSLMTPLEAGFGPTGFTFSFQNIYNYGGGIANLGTYTPLSKPKDDDYDNAKWFRFGRTPTVAPCWCNGLFMVKSNTAVAAVDLKEQTFCTLSLHNDIESYGDVLCSYGDRQTIVTAMNIDDTATMQASGNADDATRTCIVRCWQALG